MRQIHRRSRGIPQQEIRLLLHRFLQHLHYSPAHRSADLSPLPPLRPILQFLDQRRPNPQ